VGADRFGDSGKRHLLRIAKGDVADPRITSPFAVARVEIKMAE
jgi:hypothetical protein